MPLALSLTESCGQKAYKRCNAVGGGREGVGGVRMSWSVVCEK